MCAKITNYSWLLVHFQKRFFIPISTSLWQQKIEIMYLVEPFFYLLVEMGYVDTSSSTLNAYTITIKIDEP
ncbi:MAG: hypothetical protein CMC13_05540 [Flavobacteriaceae bacterium]|nr:hypothetical protein [Flavobacteriaceae bacterium]